MGNRNKANIILAIVFILFLISLVLKFFFKTGFIVNMFCFISEAALVGGIADWFAVTALFKKPLGFPWHTAIIPKNREKIIDSVSNLVKNELLSTESIIEKINYIKPAEHIINSLDDKTINKIADSLIENLSMNLSKNKDKVSENIEGFIKENLKNVDLNMLINNNVQKALQEQKHKEWLISIIKSTSQLVEKDFVREKILNMLIDFKNAQENTQNKLGGFLVKTLFSISQNSDYNDMYSLSKLLQNELVKMLDEISVSQNPLFEEMLSKFEHMFECFEKEKSMHSSIELWKTGLIDHLELKDPIKDIITSMIESDNKKAAVIEWMSDQLKKYLESLKHDSQLINQIDDMLKSVICRVVQSEHYIIEDIVREAFSSFTNERLNKFVDDKVGEDLQWIRINGSVVGAILGFTVFLFLNLIYDPFVVPAIHKWFNIITPK